jgi:hypothetical protein
MVRAIMRMIAVVISAMADVFVLPPFSRLVLNPGVLGSWTRTCPLWTFPHSPIRFSATVAWSRKGQLLFCPRTADFIALSPGALKQKAHHIFAFGFQPFCIPWEKSKTLNSSIAFLY